MSNSSFEARIVETRYGKRLWVRVGDERVRLGERRVMGILSAVIDAVFGKSRGNRQQ